MSSLSSACKKTCRAFREDSGLFQSFILCSGLPHQKEAAQATKKLTVSVW
jgi:hypothetical protein